MIIGIGHDMVDIRRIERAVLRYGSRFLDRIFTPAEQALAAQRSADPAVYSGTLAKRFAAKEALAKALGTGVGRYGVLFRSLEVIISEQGVPGMVLHDGAACYLQNITPEGRIVRVYLSMTDEYPYASAFVLLETAMAEPSFPR